MLCSWISSSIDTWMFFDLLCLNDILNFFPNINRSNIKLNSKTQFNRKRKWLSINFVYLHVKHLYECLIFIRYIAQGNGIVSVIQSNWYFHSLSKIQESSLWTTPRSYGDQNNSSCGTNSMCTSPAGINGSSIPGFRAGCYTLLQSTLECHLHRYNQIFLSHWEYSYSSIWSRSFVA